MHCDDLIDDLTQPECLRKYLGYQRQPAIDKTLPEDQEPTLFATLKADMMGHSYLGYWNGGNPAMKDVPLKAGQRVRVVMASRFGDVGITPNLKATRGYVTRVAVTELEGFSAHSDDDREKRNV